MLNLTITAKSPVSHGGYEDGLDVGNLMQFRQMQVIHDGEIVRIPVISGNAIRGKIRRMLAREYFDTLQLVEMLAAERPGVYDRLYTLLATGGTLGSDLAKDVNPEHIREIRSKMPIFSLLGGAAYKYILSGMVSVGFAQLNCREVGKGSIPAAAYLAEIGQVKHVDATEENKELTENKPMPYTIEVVIQGAVFTSNVRFEPQASSLERACFLHGLELVKSLGGKSASGYGDVDIKIDGDCLISGEEYVTWLRAAREDVSYIDFVKSFARGL